MIDSPGRIAGLADPSAFQVTRGTCFAIYAYDVASSINLDEAQRRLERTQRQTVDQKGRAPGYFQYQPAPLRLTFPGDPLPVGPFTSRPVVELVMYDFGAISVSFSFPIAGAFPRLLPLAEALRGNTSLLAEARRHVDRLMELLGSAAERPRIAPFVEDYVIFEIDDWLPRLDADELVDSLSAPVSQILRAETRELSEQETEQAVMQRCSFGPSDLTVIDTDAALVFDPDAADIRAIIEFANAQLLEMRVLDQQLDDALERSYDLLSRHQSGKGRWIRFRSPETWTVAQYQIDSAVLFERVTNSLKFIGEQYLTRIYGIVSRRFHLAEWDASIGRKLQTIESIYDKMTARAATRRMEVLEWIIILLIAASIVLPFIPGAGAK